MNPSVLAMSDRPRHPKHVAMTAAHRLRPSANTRILCLSVLLIIDPLHAKLRIYAALVSTPPACDGAATYCSIRATPPPKYIGSIHSNSELKTALAQLSFKNEVIVSAENRPDDALAWFGRFQKAGYAHLLLTGPSEQFCQLLSRGLSSVGCGWYKQAGLDTPERPGFLDYIIWQKHLTAARVVRLGYNCMVVDTDFYIFEDFYLHIKQPPLSTFHLITQAETYHSINSGFLYAQNVSKNGPVAWAFADAVLRNVRWVSNPKPLEQLGVEHTCWDQSSVHDAVFSTVGRRPMFPNCFQGRRNQTVTMEDWFAAIHRVYMASTGSGVGLNQTTLTLPIGHPAEKLVPGRNFTVGTTSMYMPHVSNHLPSPSNGSADWPTELGGQIYGVGLTAVAQAFLNHFFVQDIDAPLWPDPEDPATATTAAAVPPETFCFAPMWLLSCYQTHGVVGRWHTSLTKDAGSVLGHIWAGLPPGDYGKLWTFQAAGVYDYELAAKCFGASTRAYTASHAAHTPLPPLLAYAPGVINASISHDAFGVAVVQLAKLAVAMGRIVGWPGVPMAAPWTHTRPGSRVTPASNPDNPSGHGLNGKPHTIPWTYLNTSLAFPYPTKAGSLDELEGIWTPLNFHGCVRGHKESVYHFEGTLQHMDSLASHKIRYAVQHNSTQHPARGLFPTELQHFISKLPPESSQPGSHNTLQVAMPSGQLSFVSVVEEAQRLKGQPVVWLAQLLSIGELPAGQAQLYRLWERHCCALQYPTAVQTQEDRCKGLSY